MRFIIPCSIFDIQYSHLIFAPKLKKVSMFKFIVSSLVLVFLIASCQTNGTITQTEKFEGYRIVGYLFGSKKFDPAKIAVEKMTHINYAFVDIDSNGRIASYLDHDPANFAVLNLLRERNPDIKILLSVGGWGKSQGFSDAALTEKSRAIFARSAIDFMKVYELDGIDLDWEYPGQPGNNNPYRAEDKQNFTLLLKAFRERLELETLAGRRRKNPYLLTVATAANQRYLDHTEMDKAIQYLDFVNIMTYDFAGGWTDTARHHANLFPSSAGDGSRIDVVQAIQQHVDAGIPIEKIVMGVPFYGRYWTGVSPSFNGLNQVATGEKGSYPYHTISQEMINKNGFFRYWEEGSKSNYLWNDSTRTFITYEDPRSLKVKAEVIKQNGLGGVMFWQYDSDTTGQLLDLLYEELGK